MIDKTFRAGEKFRQVRTETNKMQFLYDSGDAAVFMDTRDYEQLELPRDVAGDAMSGCCPTRSRDPLRRRAPDRRPGRERGRHDRDQDRPGPQGRHRLRRRHEARRRSRPGVEIEVPLFINEGERVRVDTRTGEYVGRA